MADFFSIADFFFEKSVFSAKSGELVLHFEKFILYLNSESSSKIDPSNGKKYFM